MKRCLLQVVAMLLLTSATAYGQAVTGKVTSSLDGSGVPGASIIIKGTTLGTTTDADGKFSINPPNLATDVLVVSFIGFATQEVAIQNRTVVDVMLAEDVTSLNEVVVTALGIEKDTKSLTYAVQQVDGKQLTQSRDINMINGLAGKVAGVTINRSASGPGGSTRVVIRGNKSTVNNQALYVVDGVPMQNPSIGQPTDVWGQSAGSGSSGRDGGDAISNINPDDIESVSVLKGASAAALYGSQAANGVVIITTKKGKAGEAKIDFSSNFTSESILLGPKLQYKYGQTGAGTRDSWGSVVNAPNHVDKFFKNGSTWTNSLSVSAGTDNAQTYVSYSNTTNKGIMPTSTFDRHTLNLRETAKAFNQKLTIDASINVSTQKSHNRPVSGIYGNALTGLYLFPRGLDFNDYKENYEYFSPTRNMNLQNWWNINFDEGMGGEDDQQNPYWVINRNTRDDSRDRVFGSVLLKYKLNEWLEVQTRGRYDKSFDKYEFKAHAGTQGVFAAKNGRYTVDQQFNTQLYEDILLLANKRLSDKLELSATLGSSIQDFKSRDGFVIDATPNDPTGLNIPNVFSIWNISPTAERVTQTFERKQIQGIFASVQLAYQDKLFFDVTARNDWSSALAYTPSAGKGFFYYSAGVNGVISQMLTLPEVISFAKVRVSYAKVGNDFPAYITNPRRYQVNGTRTGADQQFVGPNPLKPLEPEDNRSFEVGTELRFLNDRIGIDFTYYANNNYNQFVTSPATAGGDDDFSTWYWNLGNISNKGIELALNVQPVKNETIAWNSSINITANKNKVVSLSDESVGISKDNWQILSDFGVNMYGSFIREGGRWGDLYANKAVKRIGDAIVVDTDGKPVTENFTGTSGTTPYQYTGNPTPKFNLGWNNSIDIKNFNVSFLIDGRFGGQVVSVTQAYLDYYGYSEASADARDNGGVDVKAVLEDGTPYEGKLDAKAYYQAIGNRSGALAEYTYDATNVRLRELSLGYRLPKFSNTIKSVSVSLVGRNLFFITKDAPFDPDLTMSTGNNLQGVDVFGLPSTRSIGFNLKVGF